MHETTRNDTEPGYYVGYVSKKAIWLDYGYIRAEISLYGKRAVRVACYWDRKGDRVTRDDALSYLRNYMSHGGTRPSNEHIESLIVIEAQERVYVMDNQPTS